MAPVEVSSQDRDVRDQPQRARPRRGSLSDITNRISDLWHDITWVQPVVVGAAAAVISVAAIVLWPKAAASAPEDLLPTAQAPQVVLTEPEVLVHVSGAIASPGVYRLRPGSRLIDLVDSAGGLAVDASTDSVNLAAVLHDGERIHLPSHSEVDANPALALAAEVSGGSSSGVVDLNSATAEQLQTLPGIGPSLAAAIIASREGDGFFAGVSDLDRVPGIGPAKLQLLDGLATAS